jgi:hypothetical protein
VFGWFPPWKKIFGGHFPVLEIVIGVCIYITQYVCNQNVL